MPASGLHGLRRRKGGDEVRELGELGRCALIGLV